MFQNTIKPDNIRPETDNQHPETLPEQAVLFDKDGFACSDGLVPCFCYNTHTFEYIGSADMWVSKHCGLPAGAVLDEPKVKPGKNKVIFRQDQAWALVEDYRNMLAYRTGDGAAQLITELGPLPDGFTLLPYFAGAVWNGKKWVPGVETLPLIAEAAGPDQLAVLQDKIDRMEALLAQVMSEPAA